MTLQIPFVTTFSEVSHGKPLILKDDYGRVEVALNQGSFAKMHPVHIGDDVVLRKNTLA
ncbi:SAM-dependent chlorinase/fluorinase [Candidatus Woesearchaeota archaeon]|nr:SAM-dependent chlorinase/fluorinase [Candidatus Woesearchaeota archaeon]